MLRFGGREITVVQAEPGPHSGLVAACHDHSTEAGKRPEGRFWGVFAATDVTWLSRSLSRPRSHTSAMSLYRSNCCIVSTLPRLLSLTIGPSHEK
jgi:hypothetical protein